MNACKAHPAQQRRSKDKERRLLDAAESLMSRAEWEEISISEIALAAGASVGGFYARFSSKDALLLTLHQRYEAARNAHFESFFAIDWSDEPLSGRLRGLVDCVVDLMHERRAVLRTFLLRYWRRPDDFDGAFNERLGGVYARACALLTDCTDAISHRQPQKAAAMTISMVAAFCRDALVLKPAPGPGAVDQSLDDLKRELAAMALAYLENRNTDE